MPDRLDWIFQGGKFVPSVPVEPAVSGLFPAGTTTRVMAVGDSLTQGQGAEGTGGYRLKLWNKMRANGLQFLPVGPNDQPPYSDNGDHYYRSKWAGFGGWQMGDIAGTGQYNTTGKAITQWIADHNPQVLLLMIGTNDLSISDMVELRRRFNALLDVIYAAKPTIHIVLARIPQYQTFTWSVVTSLNNMMVEELTTRVAANPARKMAVANMESIRGEAKYSDYVHLGPAGYTEMADLWYDAVTTA